MFKMSVSPLVGALCCVLLVSWASAGADEDKEARSPENEDKFKDYFEFYIKESNHSGEGCNMELAKMCLLGLSNGTLTAMISSDPEEKKRACEMVWRTKMCIEGVMISCPERHGMDKILDPYVPLLTSIAETVCNEGMEDDTDEDEPNEGNGQGEERDTQDSWSMSMEEKKGCDLNLVGMCISGFFYTAVGASRKTSPFSFTDGLCWQTGTSLSCLASTMPKCRHKKIRNFVSMMAAELQITQEAACKKSKGCNFERAMENMMAFQNAVDSPLVQMQGSPLSCSIMDVTLTMTMADLKDCPQEVYSMVSGGIHVMYKAREAVCIKGKYPYIAMPPVPMLDEVTALGAIVNSPFATKENVCPLFEIAMKKLMTMKSDDVKPDSVMNLMDTSMRMMGELCADEKMWADLMNRTLMNDPNRPCMFTESTMCDIDRARVCVAQSQLDMLLGDVEMFGWEPVCSGIEKMTRCVQYMTNGCKNSSEVTIERISPKVREIFSAAADHCPVKTLLEMRGACYPRKCNIHHALSCFSVPTERDIASGQTCSFINKTLSCITGNINGCGMLESAQPVAYALKRYLDWLKPYCMDIVADQMLKSLPECSVKYLDGFNFVLTHSTNFIQDFCGFHMHMADQCDDMEDLPAFPTYSKAKLYSRAAMISWMCQKKGFGKVMNETMIKMRVEELSMESRNVSEMEMMNYEMAGSCLTTYMLRLLEFFTLPIPQRKTLCSDVEYTKKCVHDHFANATEARKQTAMEAMKVVMMLHQQVCPMEMMEMPKMDNTTCNVNASVWCLGMMGKYLSSASAFHTETHCGAVSMAMHCVYNNTMNCTPSEKALVKEAMDPILSLAGSACEVKTEEGCNVTRALIGRFLPETCDQTAIQNCWDWYNNAKDYYILTNNTKALCSMGQQAVMCAQASSRSCDAGTTNTLVTTPMEALKNDLQMMCRAMFSEMETRDRDNSTKMCEIKPAMVPCVGDVEMCFNSLNPAEICGNQTSIKACISLMMKGCDKYMVYSYSSSIKMNQDSLEEAIKGSCKLVPDTLPTMPSNFSQDMKCIAGNDVFANYLFNDSATEGNLCEIFTNMSKCMVANASAVSVPWREALESISHTVRKQVYFRCTVVDNMNMVYKDDGRNSSDFEIPQNSSCDVMTASICMYNYAASNLFPAFYPIREREQTCRKRSSDVMCIHKNLMGCPAAVKMKTIRVLDWFNSIGKSIGICNEEPPRKCQPKEAMKCVSMLSEGIMMYGMTEQAPAVCSGIVSTELCVLENTAGCEAGERATVEDAYRDVSGVAVKTCQMDNTKPMQVMQRKFTEMCDMRKAKMCLTGMFDKVAMTTVSMEEVDKKKLCGELHMMAECVKKSSMNCDEEDKKKMAAHAPLVMGLLMGTCSEEEDEQESHESNMCKMTAVRCLRDYIQISTMDSLSDYCRQVPPTMKCLSSAMTGCNKKFQSLVGMAIDQIGETSGMVCKSEKCNMELASMCMMEAGALLKMPPQTFTESPLWCGFVKHALSCVEMHGKSCDMSKMPLSAAWYNSSKWMVGVLCREEPTPNPVLGLAPAFQLEGLFSLVSLLGNRYSTKETICPHYRNMMMSVYEASFVLSPEVYAQMIQVYRLPLKTVGHICYDGSEGWTMSDKKATCDVKAAYRCAQEAGIHSKITSSVFYGWKPVCQSMEKMTCCIESATSDCTDHKSLLDLRSLYREIYTAVGDKCSPRDISIRLMKSCPMPVPKKCEITNAKSKCLLNIRSESDKQQICSKLSDVVKCVKEHTEGCAAAQNAPLEFILHKYKEWRQSACDLSSVDTQVMVKDETSDVANCSMVLMNSYYKGLTTKSSFIGSLCSAKREEEKCIQQAKYIPLPIQFNFAETMDAYQEFKKMCNQTFENKPMPSEPSSCMMDVAAMCVVSYSQTLIRWRLTPMAERLPMCGKILDVQKCVNNSVQTCSKQRQDVFRDGLISLVYEHMEACPSSILPTVKQMDDVCSPEMASMCLEHYGMYLTEITPGKKREACSKFHETLECVHQFTKNCSDSVKGSFAPTLDHIRNILGDSCPLLSTVMCNTDMWESTLQNSRCELPKANQCLMKLDEYARANMTKMDGMCMEYAKTLECVLQNTITCKPEDVKEINTTVHVIMATLGYECMKIAAKDSRTGNSGMQEMSLPLLAALQTCKPRPVCTTRWLDCAPDMNVTVVCDNGEKIAKCMLEKAVGCSNGAQLLVAQDVRIFAQEIQKYYRGGKCNFSEVVMERTNPLVPYMFNKACYLQFSANITAVMKNASTSFWDVCPILSQTQRCIEMQGTFQEPLIRGMWKSAAHQVDLNKCFAGYAEEMMKMNMSREDRKMMEMENWNMTDLYNRTMKESSQCDMEMATNCIQYIGNIAVFGGRTPMIDRAASCRDIAIWQKCVLHSTMQCSAKLRMKFLNTAKTLNNLVQSKGFCLDAKEVAKDSFRAEVMKMECNEKEAMQCLGMLSLSIQQQYYMETRSAVCSHLLPVEVCIAKNTLKCMPHVRKSIEATYMDLKTIAKNLCKSRPKTEVTNNDHCLSDMPMKQSTVCSIPEAMYCMNSVHAKILKMAERKESVCSVLPELRTCVWKYVGGCERCQQDSVYHTMQDVFRRLSKLCPSAMCNPCGARWCADQLNMTMMMKNKEMDDQHDMTMMKEKQMSCVDVWKTRQCMEMNLATCSQEETHHVRDTLERRMAPMIPTTCQAKLKFSECALHFAVMAQKIIGVSEDMMPKAVLAEVQKIMEEYMKNMPKPPTYEEQLRAVRRLVKIVGSMEKSQSCPPESDGWPWGLPEDRPTQCKEATSAWHCMETHMQQLPMDKVPMVNASLHLIGQLLKDKCDEKPLKCFSCKNAKSNEECNTQPMETCKGHNQMCYTVTTLPKSVNDTATDEKTQNTTKDRPKREADDREDMKEMHGWISKGCTRRIPLLQQDTQCMGEGKCEYACYKSDCNYMTHSAIRDDMSCDPKMAAICGMHLVSDLLSMERTDCGKVQEYMQCMYHHTAKCMSSSDQHMHMHALQLASTPGLVRCYAEPEMCQCGRCTALIFTNLAQNPLMSREQVCMAAAEAQSTIMKSVMTQDCTMEDMKNLYEATELGMSMLGDMCNPPFIGAVLGKPKYNMTCSREAAAMCQESTPWEEYAKKNDTRVCGMVRRMFYCSHLHTEKCVLTQTELTVAMAAMSSMIGSLKHLCDFSPFEKAVKSVQSTTQLSVEQIRAVLMQAFKEDSLKGREVLDNMKALQKTVDVMERQHICKPSVALHNCFSYVENVSPSEFCGAANKTHECIEMMTKDCNPMQRAPVSYLFGNILYQDPRQCGIPSTPAPEVAKSPYYQLAACAANYTMTVQRAYATSVAQTSIVDMCAAAIMLDRCVYHTEVSSTAKVMVGSMAMLTKELVDLSCGAVPMNWTGVACKKDDVVCVVMKNMSKPVEKQDPPPQEPSTCEAVYAAGCLGNYLMRILTSAFVPVSEQADVCWERMYMEQCVVSRTASCTYNRKEEFLNAVEWFKNITNPGCSVVTTFENANCSKAQECVAMGLYYLTEKESYEDLDGFCWGASEIAKCIEHHASNCSRQDIVNIREGVEIMGNVTHFYCPHLDAQICPLSKMEGSTPGAVCQVNNMRMCINRFYEQTHEDLKLSDQQYCSILSQTTDCVMRNSSNCHPETVNEMKELIIPGILKANVNCSILTQTYLSYTSCPIVGNCSIAYAMGKITEAVAQSQIQGVNQCNLFFSVQNELLQQTCFPVETSIINKALLQFSGYLNEAYGCNKQTLGIRQVPGVVFDNSELAKCADEMGENLGNALANPRYGVWDICDSAQKYHGCLKTLFSKAKSTREKFIRMTMKKSYMDIESFVNGTCAKLNMTQLRPVSPAAEPRTCAKSLAVGCVLSFSQQAMLTGQLRPGDTEQLCRSRIDYYHCMKNVTAGCSNGFTTQLQTMLSLADSVLMGSGQCPDDVMMQAKRMQEEAYMEMVYGPARNDITIKLVTRMMMDRMQYKQKDDEEGEMGEDDEDDKEGMDKDDMKEEMDKGGKEDMEKDDKMEDDDEMDKEEMGDKSDMKTMGKMMKGCNTRMASRCMMYFSNIVIKVNRSNVMGHCRELEKAMPCVWNNVKECDEVTQYVAVDTIKKVTHYGMSMCKAAMYKMMRSGNMSMSEREEMGRMMMSQNMSESMREEMREMMGNSGMSMSEDSEDSMNRMEEEEMDDMEREMMDGKRMKARLERMFSNMDPVTEVRERVMSFMAEGGEIGDNLQAIMKLLSVAPEDGMCVDPAKYKEFGRCDPAVAMECLLSVDRELLNPMSTRSRLCLKQNIAMRCYAAMTVGCDHMTSTMLGVSMSLMMYKTGDKCETKWASPCKQEEDRQCEMEEAEECLEGLHKVVLAAKDFLPGSATQMCMVATKTKQCLMEKLAHCDTKTKYGFHDALRPAIQTLDYICETMPALGCVTSFLWKSASSVLLTSDLAKVGSAVQTMKFFREQNMSMPDALQEKMWKEMGDRLNGSRSEAMTMYAGWLGRLTGKAPECMEKEDNMHGMEGVLTSVSGLIKLTMMESGLVHPEMDFVEHVEMMISMDDKDSVLSMAISAINRTLVEHDMHLNHSYLIRTAVKEIVQMGDSTKMLQFFYAKMAKSMIMKTMEKMGMKMKMDEMEEEEMEMEMQRWMVAELANKVREMMPNMTRMMRSPDYTIEYLSKSMEVMKMKKWSSCSELAEAARCLERYTHLIPAESRATLNVTMHALFTVAGAVCEPTKCFQCNGMTNNEQCNLQGFMTCDPGQGCTTTVADGKIYKGCAYPTDDYKDDRMNFMTCMESWCNKPLMTTHKEKDPMCQPYMAIQCGMDLVPSLVLNRTPNMRDIYKASWCMDYHTSRCVHRGHQAASQLGFMIKRTALEGACAGDPAQYECGLRSVIGLATAINKPAISRAAICYELNNTLTMIRTAQAHNKCSEYDSIAVYEGIKTIMQILGHDYCPGMMARDNASCEMMTRMMLGDNKDSKCEVEEISQCVEEHKLLHSLVMMSDMEKMKATKNARPRDYDQVCMELFLASRCISSKINSCSQTIQHQVMRNVTNKMGFFIRHCPISNMMHEMCSPLPMPEQVCNIPFVKDACFGRFISESEMCSVDRSDLMTTLGCIANHTSGCAVAQGVPVFNMVFDVMARVTMKCGALNRVFQDNQNMYKMTEEMVAKMIMEYNIMMKTDNERDNKPMSGILNSMLMAKYAQKTQNMTAEVVFASLSPLLRNVTTEMENAAQMALFGDETKGVAVCNLDYIASFRRALMNPDWFGPVFCEALAELTSCLSRQNLSPVAQSSVMYMMNEMAGYTTEACKGYSEQVMWKGWMLWNLTQGMAKMPAYARLEELSKHMANGTQDKMNLTAKEVAGMLDASIGSVVDHMLHSGNETCDVYKISAIISGFSAQLVGPFVPVSQHPVLCDILNNSVIPELRPLIAKCSPAHQLLYMAVMGTIVNQTKPICDQPANNRVAPPPLCKVDEAYGCYMAVFPYLSSRAAPQDKLCRAYHYAVACVEKHTVSCTTDQKIGLSYIQDYVQSVIGDTCPFVQALRQCYSTSSSNYICNVKKAKECISVLGDYSKGVTKETCSKLPQMLECYSTQTAGCSGSDIHDVSSYLEVLMPAYKVLPYCYSQDMSATLYRSCQPPPTCSLEEAGNCYAPLLSKTSCTEQEAFSIKNCAARHLRGCNMIQLQIFDSQLWFGRQNMGSCNAFSIDSSLIPSTLSAEAQGLKQCGNMFIGNITAALQTSSSSLERICRSMQMMYECLMYNQSEDARKFLTAMYGNSFALTAELTEQVCAQVNTGETSMEAKTTGSCDTKMAAQCLAAYTFPVVFSANLNRGDKKAFCSDGAFQSCLTLVKSSMSQCSPAEVEQLGSYHTFLVTIRDFSGVCDEHFATCSPNDLMTCGMETTEMMKKMAVERNMTNNKDDNPYCSHFGATMNCLRSNSFGCSKEIKMEVVRGAEEAYCIASDLLKSCDKMEEPKMELPKCMKKGPMTATCNTTAAFACLKYLYWELESPFVDCSTMHETYTTAMQCYMENIGNCSSGQMMVANHMLGMIHKAVYNVCPMIPGHSCQEPMSCEADQAMYCVESLDRLLSENNNMENAHMCMAIDMAHACVMDKTSRCSMFSKGALDMALSAVKDKAAKAKKMDCSNTLDLCMNKFYYSSLGVLQGEMMMTNVSKIRNQVTSQMTWDMIMGNDPMMKMSQWKMSMDNISSSVIDMMSKEMEKSMAKMMKEDKSSEGKMAAFNLHVLDLMTRGLKSHQDMYLKVKAMQCMGATQAFNCIVNNLRSSSSGLRSDVAGFIAGVGSELYVVINDMCAKERSCDLMEEPDTCQILPAATLAMNQVGSIKDMKAFCDMLPHTIQNVTALIQSCKDDEVSYHFQGALSEMKAAKDTICRSQTDCQLDAAKKCISAFQTNPSCSAYESTLQCVTANLKSCDGDTVRRTELELQTLYDKIAATCIPLPNLVTSINAKSTLRLVEGGTEEKLGLKLSESPSDKCESGKTCQVKVKLQLSNNPVSTPMCTGNQERIPQVVVHKANGVADPCTFTFTSDNWERGTQIPLVASSDMLYDRVQDVNLSMVMEKYTDNQLVLTRQLPDMKLVATDTDQPAFCSSSDSYIVTFDGMTVKNRYRGEFTLYKHATMPYEVHILNQACTSRSRTCTCAAMVKSQDDVLVVDVCTKAQGSPLESPVKLYKNGDLAQGTKIYQDNDGNLIMVELPTAALVVIQRESSNKLGVFVVPSSLDWLRSEGLCGVYDANKNNDMAMPVTGSLTTNKAHFIKGWRNKAGDSLYIGAPADPTYQPPVYCTCTGDNSLVQNRCEPMLISKTCPLTTSGKDVTAGMVELSNSVGNRRNKRAVESPWAGLSGIDANYDPQDTELTRSASGNWTLTTAGQYCDNMMGSSTLMNKCQTLVGSSFTEAIKDICVQTILTNDGTSGVSIDSIVKVQCEAQLTKMAPAMSTDTSFQTLSAEIMNLVCPNDCSSNGQCEGGQCKCYRDYIGADCSIQESAAPSITSLEADGLCSLQNGGCRTVLVSGGPFSEDLSPKCHYQATQMTANGFSATGSVIHSPAQFMTSTLLVCTLPDSMSPATGTAVSAVSLSVSNNGQAVSQPRLFIAYHPMCYVCESSGRCNSTTTGCVIGGKCYIANEVNPSSVCDFCDPVTVTTEWTKKIVPGCPGSDSNPTSTTTKATTPSNPNGAGGQGQNKECSTPAPVVEQDKTLAIILGAFAALFFLTTVVMGCKACRTSGGTKHKSLMSDDKESKLSSNSASSIEEKNTSAFVNETYNDNIKEVVVDPKSSFVYGAVATKTEPKAKGSDPTSLYPDVEGVEN
ncbi:uncharacterized protein LOC133203073 [Saccostrea echinata]|uniref:uncharacterized protein LOC133203073 n=1 Tax=Saccostrea echinata TaxID=191078 RepID=UPI002A83608F|nr:uncharacterized protein LOC133203073 [Saccostrea echinata]